MFRLDQVTGRVLENAGYGIQFQGGAMLPRAPATRAIAGGNDKCREIPTGTAAMLPKGGLLVCDIPSSVLTLSSERPEHRLQTANFLAFP